MGYLWVLFGLFVVLAEVIRRDALKEGVDSKHAWYFGLFFGGLAAVIAFGLITLIT